MTATYKACDRQHSLLDPPDLTCDCHVQGLREITIAGEEEVDCINHTLAEVAKTGRKLHYHVFSKTKTPKALMCEACKSRKVKCVRPDLSGSCARCQKMGIACVTSLECAPEAS